LRDSSQGSYRSWEIETRTRRAAEEQFMPRLISPGSSHHHLRLHGSAQTLHVRLMQVLTGRNGRLMKIAERIQSQPHCQASRHVAQAPSTHTHSKALAWIKKLIHHILRHHCTTGAFKGCQEDAMTAGPPGSNASDPVSDFCTRSNRERIYQAPLSLDRNIAYSTAWPKGSFA
jgi:hypothetical protein